MNEEKPKLVAPETVSNDFKIRKRANCYQRKFSKASHERMTYHSLEECYQAALLEIDPSVKSFTPQPKQYGTFGNRYIPDFYYITRTGEEFVLELKPNGVLAENYRRPMERIAEREGFTFLVVDKADVKKEEILAVNSMHIANVLNPVGYLDTRYIEEELQRKLLAEGSFKFDDVVFAENRVGRQHYEIALFKLLCRGKLQMELKTKRISFDSIVRFV